MLGILHSKILGAGWSNCEQLYEAARKAVALLGVEAEIEKITDCLAMMKYGVLQTPALVIDEEVVAAGKAPSPSEMTTIPTTALANRTE